MWRATSRTNCLKSSVRATKSVSQFTSTSTPTRPLKWMYASTSPSDASRPARVSALAAPFLRSTSTAFSRSPPASSSARLQSIIPAPVRARSSATCFAPTSFTLATVAHSSIRTPPSRRGARRAAAGCDRSRPGVGLGLAPAARFRWCGCRCLLGLQARRDGLGLRPPLATRRLLLALALRLRLDAGLRPVGHCRALLPLLEALDLLLDGLEVGQRAAQPALGHPERTAALRLGLDDVLELLLGADEQDALTLQHHAPHELLRGFELTQRLLEIDDVDAAALGVDEAAHLRVPPSGLVPEVDPRLEQVLQLGLRHGLPFMGSIRRCRHLRCHPEGTQHRIGQRVCLRHQTSDVRRRC